VTTPQTASIELRDPLWGPVPVTPAELRVIDTPLFQRLRQIKQLGFAELVFPGAVHHRYLHSIGAMHVAGLLADAVLGRRSGLSPGDRARLRQLVRLAALLHDIGHPPLSHAAESLLPDRAELIVGGRPLGEGRASHEDMTRVLITGSPLTAVLDESFRGLDVSAEDVAAVIADDPGDQRGRFAVAGLDYWPLLHAMVSGEMDVDRMDYLRRDAYFAGVSYGAYDASWLISSAMALDDEGVVRLGIDMRALPTFEHFLLARYHMFQMVYFHPKSDIYDAMLRRWLAAVGEAARFPADPARYVRCHDAWLMQRLEASDDPWAQRVCRRSPYALLTELRSEEDRGRLGAITAALEEAGVDVLAHGAKPVLSRYALVAASTRESPLLVVDLRPPVGRRRVHRIEEVTDLYGRYERTLRLERLYVPPAERERARSVLADLA